MIYSQSKKRRLVSKVLAVIGVILLTADTINTFTSQDGLGFLNLADRQSGMSLGIPSIILLIASFGIGYGLKTKLVTLLLIYGGLLLALSKIIEPTFGLNLYLTIALPNVYISLIIIGFVIIGLGLWRLIKNL
ncbi:MAG: hypothetical protein L0H53_14845 [Candidatus Nitrosocosmicus sp.]|nr:hypothetical protein [Candidatus Nitrosocosmicus sp.]MDN5868694.1 hypothetical protein [Candidatus Nitrosocosmicus sp.]